MAIKLISSGCLGVDGDVGGCIGRGIGRGVGGGIGRGVGGGFSSGCIDGRVGSRGVSSMGVSRKATGSKGISLPKLAFLVGIGLVYGKQWVLVWHWPQLHR